MRNWTEQQKNAINARGRNILVSAAAGSGKTAVLSERVVSLITDSKNPIDINSLLVVTFTNAAAAEMKSRIQSSLEMRAKEDPYNENIRKQLTLLPSANICTIDSFCLNLVRDHCYGLGLSYDFQLFDPAENSMVEDKVANDVVDEFFEEGDRTFLDLFELLSTPKNDDALINVIKELYHFIYAQPFPYKWLDDIIELYNPENKLTSSKWFTYVKDELKNALEYCLELINESYNFIDYSDKYCDKYVAILDEDKQTLNDLLECLDMEYDNIVDLFSKIKFPRLPSIRNYSSEMKTEISKRQNIYKDVLNDIKKEFMFSCEDDYSKQMKTLHPILLMLKQVIKRFDESLKTEKAEKNRYSFSDIEHYAIEILLNEENGVYKETEIAKTLKEEYKEILIDEYQDTNEAQDKLFSTLSDNDLFMVGDVKQSIYKFRLAMPYIFVQKKNAYIDYKKDDANTPCKIILDKNFRSRDEICKYVNFMFSNFMTKRTGEIDYNEEEFLHCAASYESANFNPCQIKIFNGVSSEDSDEKEARYIAKTILAKIANKELIMDGNETREIDFSDFAILFRSAKKHIDKYAEILSEYNIPVTCDNNVNLFENSEVTLLLSYLKVINNPLNDIDLLSVMLSPLYFFTTDEIAEIEIENRGNFHNAVLSSENGKVKAFLSDIEMLGRLALTMPVSSFIRYICDYKKIYAFSNALSNGEQRRANINKFISFAEQYDSSDSFGLASFIRLADMVSKDQNPPGSAELNSVGCNSVTMMSVHKSKGLEFPVVIYAGTARHNIVLDNNLPILLNPQKGIGLKIHNEEKLYRCKTLPYAVIENTNKISSISENLRVLYVAMTRAKEQFISFISVDDINKTVQKISKKITSNGVSEYNARKLISDSDYILASALMHKDGKTLRNMTDLNINPVNSNFDLDIEIINNIDEIRLEKEKNIQKPNNDTIDKIAAKLKFEYKNLPLANISAKRAASGLDSRDNNTMYFCLSKPAFMNNGSLSPTEKGTAMHEFMQFCDYESAKDNLENEICRLTEKKQITEKQAKSLNRKALYNFFNSKIACRMFNAKRIKREFKITSYKSIKDIEGLDFDEKILVEGIVDFVFEENNEMVIVDYKTDNVENDDELISLYTKQIEFYKSAIFKTFRKNVKEAYLYSFALNRAIKI